MGWTGTISGGGIDCGWDRTSGDGDGWDGGLLGSSCAVALSCWTNTVEGREYHIYRDWLAGLPSANTTGDLML